MNATAFRKLFVYDQNNIGSVGVERECFILNPTLNVIVPEAHKVLSSWKGGAEFGYELSACQIELRVGPCAIDDLEKKLTERDGQLNELLGNHGYVPLHTEVGPENMSLEVYPDSRGRYRRITEGMPRSVLLAACRVAGTHVHIGMPDHDTTLHVYNSLLARFNDLCEMGDGSFGERLRIYKEMAPKYLPVTYANWDQFYQVAIQDNFAKDPRRCWTLIRISPHGTIEFRMFGATNSIRRITRWAEYCHLLCATARTLR